MDALETLLAGFERSLQPHEAFFVRQGLQPWRWHREKNLPDDFTPCAYLDPAAHDSRAAAHGAAAHACSALLRLAPACPWPPGAFESLLALAVMELRLNTVSAFPGFALLLNAMAGPAGLMQAAALYAAAALHPALHRVQRLSPEAFGEMAALREALAALPPAAARAA